MRAEPGCGAISPTVKRRDQSPIPSCACLSHMLAGSFALEPALAVRRAHHGNLDALIAQSSDTSCPFSFDGGPPFELEAELAKEINRPSEVIDDESAINCCLSCASPLELIASILSPIILSSWAVSPPAWPHCLSSEIRVC